jgi:hypothetical protein
MKSEECANFQLINYQWNPKATYPPLARTGVEWQSYRADPSNA